MTEFDKESSPLSEDRMIHDNSLYHEFYLFMGYIIAKCC